MFRDMEEFEQKIRNDKEANKYLFSLRFPIGFICPKCNFSQFYFNNNSVNYTCKQCRTDTNLKQGSIFEGNGCTIYKLLKAVMYIKLIPELTLESFKKLILMGASNAGKIYTEVRVNEEKELKEIIYARTNS